MIERIMIDVYSIYKKQVPESVKTKIFAMLDKYRHDGRISGYECKSQPREGKKDG